MSKESSLWDYLRDHVLPKDGHYDRIEAPETAPGFPDVRYTFQGSSGSIELKSGRAPFGKRGLRLSQRVWIRDEIEAGGTVWIVACTGSLIHWLPGRCYYVFNRLQPDRLFRLSQLVIPKGEDNRAVVRLLFKR